MPPSRLKNGIPSRRRRGDDGEEEESVLGEVEDDSVSEGSIIGPGDEDADGEASDITGEEDESRLNEKELSLLPKSSANGQHSSPAEVPFKPATDTKAMLNGLKSGTVTDPSEEVHFDELGADGATSNAPATDGQSGAVKPANLSEKSRLDHREYLRQRDTNPAFVPNRGGFFLHDDRTAPSHPSSFRTFGRGRGRGFPVTPNPFGRQPLNQGPTEQPWAHDLHESVAKDQAARSIRAANATLVAPAAAGPNVTTSSAPNRTFSVSTVLGNVTVRIYLPGMDKAETVPNVIKQQHTLLPQHRPPLRRDKPVRISIPEQSPRYIFPSTERSFIFIPRAMRPNQQAFARGRGRGSFHGSRRTSMFGGSAYSPSVAMSRKSSFGGATPRADLHSPAGSAFSRQAGQDVETGKPVVRMPTGASLPFYPGSSMNGQHAVTAHNFTDQIFHRENQSESLPIHQPRPQKTVSVADIESPASFSFHPPQQQQEQPFHHQVPINVANANGPSQNEDPVNYNSHSRRQSHAALQAGTPLSQIPETAIYAQPFQPYPMLSPPGYFAPPYPPGTLFYPPIASDGLLFNGSMASSVMAPNFVPAAQQSPFVVGAVPARQAQDPGPPNTVAHESNGMVYYYDPSQIAQGPRGPMPQFSMPQPGGVIGMGGMMTPPAHFYYPPAPNGMYYGPQT